MLYNPEALNPQLVEVQQLQWRLIGTAQAVEWFRGELAERLAKTQGGGPASGTSSLGPQGDNPDVLATVPAESAERAAVQGQQQGSQGTDPDTLAERSFWPMGLDAVSDVPDVADARLCPVPQEATRSITTVAVAPLFADDHVSVAVAEEHARQDSANRVVRRRNNQGTASAVLGGQCEVERRDDPMLTEQSGDQCEEERRGDEPILSVHGGCSPPRSLFQESINRLEGRGHAVPADGDSYGSGGKQEENKAGVW